jgi:hypothetical protein
MSVEPSMERHATAVALGSASRPLSRLVVASRTIAGESESRPMLRLACRELTQMLEAASCAISRLEGGMIRAIAEYSFRDGFQEPCERGYYLADYPVTAAALEEKVLYAISADDPWQAVEGTGLGLPLSRKRGTARRLPMGRKRARPGHK